MKRSTGILLCSITLAMSCWLWPQNGFCVGEIERGFIPAETYPRALKDMHLQTAIVDDGAPRAVMVVDAAAPFYSGLASDINAAIQALPDLSRVSLEVIDDDTFLTKPRFTDAIILIGNYATNTVIRRCVYEKELQSVDLDRPGADSWVINNLRIGLEADGKYQSSNAIVIASESPEKLREAVDLFRTEMLAAAYDGGSIVFDESAAGTQSTRWSATPGYRPPDSIPPNLTESHGLEGAVDHANRYWLTGRREGADAFVNILNNYGRIAEDPQWFGVHPNGRGFNSQVGDNSGALDFLMEDLITAWTKVQRSPYFSDPGLPHNPTTGIDERLYIDKLINWMLREYYKCAPARGLIDPEDGGPAVRGAIGYAERDGFPLGNHELSAAIGIFAGGQYFTRDGYRYDAANVRDYSYDESYPDDHAAQWLRDGDTAFAPYLKLSWGNDDAGGYYDYDTGLTREYLRLKDSPALSEAYYGRSGGALGIGMDRSVADSFCLVTPNSLMKPGFGDTHEIGPTEYETIDLRFWREKYLDGRYGWMCDDLYHVRSGYWGKSFLQYGLMDLPALGVLNEEPADLLGVKAIPLQANLFSVVSNFGGRASYHNVFYGEPHQEAHVAPGEATSKVILRSGWGHGFDSGRDQYLGIDCVSYLGHGHEDALGIFAFEDNDSIFIIDNTYDDGERGYQNAVTVRKTDASSDQQEARSNSSTVARIRDLADFANTGFVDLELPQYGNFITWGAQPAAGEWSVDLERAVFWKKEGLLVVLDRAKANDAGSYEVALRWKPNNTPEYSYTLDGDTIRIVRTAGEQHCSVRTLDASYAVDPVYGNARTAPRRFLGVGDGMSVPTLLYTYQGREDPDYCISALGDGDGASYHITSSFAQEDISLGKLVSADRPESHGDFEIRAHMFWIERSEDDMASYFALTKGLYLGQTGSPRPLFSSDRPVSVDCSTGAEAPYGGTILAGPGVTTIRGLHLPAEAQLLVDGRLESLPFSLTEGTHQFGCTGG